MRFLDIVAILTANNMKKVWKILKFLVWPLYCMAQVKWVHSPSPLKDFMASFDLASSTTQTNYHTMPAKPAQPARPHEDN